MTRPRASGVDRAGAALREVCLHEYAHLEVARHFGAAGFVTVLPVAGGRPGCTFAGRFQMFGELSDEQWRIVALAGSVAECLASDPGADAPLVTRRLREPRFALRGVDAELAGEYSDVAIADCVAVVRALWPAIQRAAEDHAAQLEA